MYDGRRTTLAGFLGTCFITAIAGYAPMGVTATPEPDIAAWQTALQAMKSSPRGPFQRIRWFCRDGTVLPPEPYACVPHGGGVQHGEWSDATRALREAGFPVATIFARLRSDSLLAPDVSPDLIPSLLLEQFLIHSDDGWVLRQASYYRGAFQAEDEARSARRLLLDAIKSPRWREERFPLLREMARLLPHDQDSPLLTRIRAKASRLATLDPGFQSLRNKIHVRPEAADAARVRAYRRHQTTSRADPQQPPSIATSPNGDYEELASLIDQAYRLTEWAGPLQQLAASAGNGRFEQWLRREISALPASDAPDLQLVACALLLAGIRDQLAEIRDPAVLLQALQISLRLEQHSFRAASQLMPSMPHASRAQRLQWLRESAKSLYGTGLLTRREWQALSTAFGRLDQPQLALAEYRQALHDLERVPGWVQRRLSHYFAPAIEHLAQIEPLAAQFIPDRLRSSPLLFFAEILETLALDAQQLSQVHHQVFGKQVATGLRSLNAGLARGILSTTEELQRLSPSAMRGHLFVTSATTAELPPVAGILTASEGNELSHVQLLARDLGIPNVVVSPSLLAEILQFKGRKAVLAASPGGVVRLVADTPEWDVYFKSKNQDAPLNSLQLDASKLDLDSRLIPLDQLRTADSGRRTGPKAAQLGELSWHFPGRVSPGLVIPFGVFHSVLQRPMEPGVTAATWLERQHDHYRRLISASTTEDDTAAEHLARYLAQFRNWLQQQQLSPTLIEQLRLQMRHQFGAPGSYGVFIRSDTNVEDLPGFSGAGLNRTLPHIVDFDSVVEGIKTVWASAFTERAFSWRQLRLDRPELVQVSVLLHQSVPVDKSGVLVTADLESGASGVLSVAANEGVGGGVEGQSAESLRIDLTSGGVRLLASATASRQRQLLPQGGSQLVPALAPEQLLSDEEITQLIELAKRLPENYPALTDEQGNRLPADIEFGFVDGDLRLFQLRPFLHTPFASRSRFLSSLDSPLALTATRPIVLAEAPRQPGAEDASQ